MKKWLAKAVTIFVVGVVVLGLVASYGFSFLFSNPRREQPQQSAEQEFRGPATEPSVEGPSELPPSQASE